MLDTNNESRLVCNMNESWDDYAEGWDGNEDVISYSDKAFRTLCEVVNPEGLLILDFGCGTGLLTERMAITADRVVAVDPSEKMISVLQHKQLSNVETLIAVLSEETINTYDLFRSKYDLIVASSVCSFLPDYEGTLRLLKTLLKPNGIFVQWDWLKSGEDDDSGFNEERIESAYQRVGLEKLSITEAFSIESEAGPMKVIMGAARNA